MRHAEQLITEIYEEPEGSQQGQHGRGGYRDSSTEAGEEAVYNLTLLCHRRRSERLLPALRWATVRAIFMSDQL